MNNVISNSNYLQGFFCGTNQHDAAEDAHWPPFWKVSVEYFSEKHGLNPQKWDVNAKQLLAFLAGNLYTRLITESCVYRND